MISLINISLKASSKQLAAGFLSAVTVVVFGMPAFALNETENALSPAEGVPVRQESITVIKNDKTSSYKYKISTGDLLKMSVYGEPDFTQEDIIVRPDGYATFNPIGEVYVAGLDISELTQALERKFLEYLNEPRISITVKDFNPASVYIFGAVEKPGTYQQMTTLSKQFADSKNPIVRTDLSITNVISNAGGIAIDADLTNISVTGQDGKQRKIDLIRFIRDNDTSQNIKLSSGDVIFVPRAETIALNDEDFETLTRMSLFPAEFPVRIIGEVNQGGVYSIKGISPYLNTAVASAEGYKIEAKQSVVVVHRKAKNNKLSKIYVNPYKQDFVLRPNDLIEVRKRNFMKVVSGASYFATILQPFSIIPGIGNGWADLFKPKRRYYVR